MKLSPVPLLIKVVTLELEVWKGLDQDMDVLKAPDMGNTVPLNQPGWLYATQC